MRLTENQKELIREVSKKNIRSSRQVALKCLKEVDSLDDQWFVEMCSKLLKDGSSMYDLPSEIQGLLTVEDVSETFHEDRYYLSQREKKIFDQIIKMQGVTEKLALKDIRYINSTLMYGVPGTGKTMFGRYLAYKTNLPFAYLNFSNIVDSLLGSTAKNISKAFKFAISTPCIFMLDEIDAISTRRDISTSASADKEMSRTTITLMQEFDHLPNETIVLAATNRIDRIDEALLRRFSNKYEMTVFNNQEKKEMITKYLQAIEMTISKQDMNNLINGKKSQAETITELIQCIADTLMMEQI
ncbi:ATP-binding protein [Eggerthia catenaformis]|uniref:ATP-binding protein n=1 Tax=Eggerthia catenaformis TaxID=31973 RepID=UPI00047B4E8C|nr:ATP-binding protein [Eggerthia catenaformis]